MNCISIQELGSRAPDLARQLEQERELLVTNDGKPVGVIFAADEETLDPCMRALHQIKNMLALRRVQQESVERGLDKLTMEEIDAIIAESRKEAAA